MASKRDYKAEYKKRRATEDPVKRKAIALAWYYKRKRENPEAHVAAMKKGYSRNAEASKKYRATRKGWEKGRNYYLKSNYGITLEEYDQMFAEQNGLCFVCGRPERRTSNKGKLMELEVDHNHQTGCIRKLLCHACNVAIGFLDENPDRMRQLAAYVETFNQRSLDREGS